jgi:hypothetical protein
MNLKNTIKMLAVANKLPPLVTKNLKQLLLQTLRF